MQVSPTLPQGVSPGTDNEWIKNLDTGQNWDRTLSTAPALLPGAGVLLEK